MSLSCLPHKFRVQLVTITLCLVIPVLQTTGQNLVANGNFDAIAADWTFFAPATGTETYNPETSYGGTVTTNIIGEIDNGANLRQTGIAVVPGRTYYVSFRHTRRTTGGTPNPSGIRVKVYNGANSFLSSDVYSANTIWAWQCEIFQFTPTTDTVTLDFENITTTISTLGTIVDDITITPVDQELTLIGNACQGGTVGITAPSFPTDPNASYTDYSWTGPNGFTSTDALITFNNAQPVLNGIYTCTMILNGCLPVTGTYTLVVTPNKFDRYVTICNGDSYNFYGKTLFGQGIYDTTIISTNNSCDSLVSLHLTVNPKPDVRILPHEAVAICEGDTMTFTIDRVTAATTYQWLKNGMPLAGETGNRYQAYTEGSYQLAGLLNGCTDTSMPVQLRIHPLPLAGIIYQAGVSPVCASDTIQLEAVAGGPGYQYIWEPAKPFRTLTGAEGQTVKGVFPDLATAVILSVYSETGCYDTDTLTVYTRPCCGLFVPNAFSPDGDGLNDYFNPQLQSGQLLQVLDIYDRYGKRVYYHNGSKNGWDGNYPDGEEAAPGVYMFYIQYTCSDSKMYTQKGDLTLIK